LWVSVVSCESEVNQLQGIEHSIDDSTSPGLIAAIATLTGLTGARSILYYCDDPTFPNPIEQPASPAEFDNENRMLWDILLELIAERNVWKWLTNEYITPQLLAVAQKSLREEIARYET